MFAVEVIIALFVRDRFVRPYLGDVLAVVLVYCGLRAVLPLQPVGAAILAFAIGAVLEVGQATHVLDMLGVHNAVVRVVLGGSFEWLDFVAYAAGALLALAGERVFARSPRSR
ncbi:DUF2809 domain-containing protein [Sphingomonas sp. KR3-1]|uniref:ribosomal maturation YjgA family protein n=1 Tax=Sphingomonas sp. KR3-1 TaxID=3156611 RepID=UPI0032B5E22D